MDISTIVLGLFAAVVFGFTAACVIKLVGVCRECREESDAIERWLKERASYRTSSSIEDDSPESRAAPRDAA